MKIIELSKFIKTLNKKDWEAKSDPFAIYFVYAKDGEYMVKGMANSVSTYVKNKFPQAVWYYTFWKDGKCRGSWQSGSDAKIYIRHEISDVHKRRYWEISEKGGRLITRVRRVPRSKLKLYL